ncbi:putative PurR-regulated permease PerM [Naumannella halotolerans]|uniref:Putative PurR-regulated permease PerM n=1 Tax=Naumannella halotolerans TaxID=993414 RepID=A0A4R7J111_9ACTN|nr:putative PurR-regulated permease PerM [Naumannella halotolerans]
MVDAAVPRDRSYPERVSELSEENDGRPELKSLWTDAFGRLAVRSVQILVVIGLAALVVFAATRLLVVVIPVLIAIILACAISPLSRRLRAHMPNIVATIIIMVGGVLVGGGIIYVIVLNVMSQMDQLTASVNSGIEQLDQFISDLPFNITEDQLTQARDAVVSFVTSSSFGTNLIGGVSTAGSFITGLVLMIVILFFFIKDGPAIWQFLISPFKGERHDRFVRVGETANRVLGGYIRGTAIVAFVDTVGITIGMLVLGVPLALPLAVVVFTFAFIPIVGATAAGVLACLVALVTLGPVQALILLAVIIAVNQLEGNLLQPVVMAQSLSLHPLIVLIALTIGTVLGGVAGAVLAVPAAAVIWAIMKTWNDNGQISDESERIKRDQVRKRRKWRDRFARLFGKQPAEATEPSVEQTARQEVFEDTPATKGERPHTDGSGRLES